MPPARDFYDVLGVPRDASPEEIQRAYHRQARRLHPDVSSDPAAAERFKELTAAYEVLSDPGRRDRYDRSDGPMRGQRVRVNTGRSRGGDMDIEDLFDAAFGRWSAGFRYAPTRGADLEADIEISVEDAYIGWRGTVTLTTGTVANTFEVSIEPGAVDGQRVRLAGRGGAGTAGGRRGDLYLVVRLAPHPRYRVDGRDVTIDLPVTPWEAALGARVPVPTPAGVVEVELPPGSSSGRRMRLPGRGLPHPAGPPGDLYAEVSIVMPPSLSPTERQLFERLAKASTFDPRVTP